MLQVMQAVVEAEARGDAAGALEIVETHATDRDGRFFWNPDRVARLAQVVQLGGLLPGWATSRWILEQSLIQFDPALRGARQEAMRIAIELRGPDELPGVDAVDVQTKVMDHDWVHRQLLIYEYGGLERFLHAWATPDLVAGADRIHEWVAAPIRALRLESREPALLAWTDLASGEGLETPNLGAAVLEEPGDCALARVVPTECGPMLDGVPLGVAEKTADQVAADPRAWLDALRTVAGTEDYFVDLVHGNFLVTDVPSNISLLALHDFLPSPIPRDPDGIVTAEAVIALARHTASSGGTEPEPLDLWPCVAAELLAPDVLPHLPRRLGPADHAWLEVLGDTLPDPAGRACRALTEGLEDAA
ncbi:hypothetical protein GCM10023350_21650 [Nocardioides endophyticus]|uniref:Uncharacterized protein n=2 Tax=Nocardioides endophyticus TaxID=1353775 RepID=A0ABP8YQZ1_9ACTN